MTFDVTSVVEAVLALVGAIITCVLVPYIKSKTTAEQQKEINAWVKIAVSAAEQIYKGQGRGEEKKAYVLELSLIHIFRALADSVVASSPCPTPGRGMPLGVEPSQQEMVALPSSIDNWIKCCLLYTSRCV